jgi:hypothetical protein
VLIRILVVVLVGLAWAPSALEAQSMGQTPTTRTLYFGPVTVDPGQVAHLTEYRLRKAAKVEARLIDTRDGTVVAEQLPTLVPAGGLLTLEWTNDTFDPKDTIAVLTSAAVVADLLDPKEPVSNDIASLQVLEANGRTVSIIDPKTDDAVDPKTDGIVPGRTVTSYFGPVRIAGGDELVLLDFSLRDALVSARFIDAASGAVLGSLKEAGVGVGGRLALTYTHSGDATDVLAVLVRTADASHGAIDPKIDGIASLQLRLNGGGVAVVDPKIDDRR